MGFYHDHIVPHLIKLAMRNRTLKEYGERIIRLAEGRVLEIGVGSGMNLPFYTARVTEILGLELHPQLLEIAAQKSNRDRRRLIEGSAESIPLDSESIDTVVTTWTLCSIPDVDTALSEMRRVLKPDGQLLLVEHGLAPEERVRKWQRRLTPPGNGSQADATQTAQSQSQSRAPDSDQASADGLHARSETDDVHV